MTLEERELLKELREENTDAHKDLKDCLEKLNGRVRNNEVRGKINQVVITIFLLSSGGYGVFQYLR